MSKKDVRKCSSCGAILQFALEANLRIGGNSGQDLELFPEFKSGETALPLQVFVCSKCSKIELYAGPEIKNSLVRIAENRSQAPISEKAGRILKETAVVAEKRIRKRFPDFDKPVK